MPRPTSYYVYILTNRHRTVLYVGMTNSFSRRMHEHKTKANAGFTQRYHVDRLVYFEEHATPHAAIAREKQLKSGSRARKEALIASLNPHWNDLADDVLW